MTLHRRSFLRAAAGVAVSPWAAACATWGRATPASRPFQHGVASGDPTQGAVVLWTRVTPQVGSAGAMRVHWELSDEAGFASLRAAGELVATPDSDYTLKVDVAGLSPGASYHYRFRVGEHVSTVGRTRTLPDGSPEQVRLAFVSCSAIEAGFFGAYERLAARDDVALVLHLGDYIYEYGDGVAGNGALLGRVPEPNRECTLLGDYRLRHAQYKRDPQLQAVHARHPFIAAWDDHEFANNAWRGGAQNHQATEGAWSERRRAAMRAYREWQPVREPFEGGGACYRGFRFGDLVDLSVLDTRSERDVQLADPRRAAGHAAPERTLLGAAQERWLADRVVASQRDGVAWRAIGQQVVFAPMHDPEGGVRNPDSWEGYSATRDRLYALWEERALHDNVILTGDVHSSWALDVPRAPYREGGYDASPGAEVFAVEFVTPGVSSRSGVPASRRDAVREMVREENPHLQWVDFAGRGYTIVDFDRDRVRCEWFHVDTVERPETGERRVAAFEAPRGGGLRPVTEAASAKRPDGMHTPGRRG